MKAVFTLAFALFVAAASAHPPIVSERTDQVVIDVPAMCTFISSVMQTPVRYLRGTALLSRSDIPPVYDIFSENFTTKP